MRCFVAFELPAETRQELFARGQAGRGGCPPARWVRSENLHLTLHFIGEAPNDVEVALAEGLQRAFSPWPPMEFSCSGLGAFPLRGPARVLWCGVDADGDLSALQRSVTEAVDRSFPAAIDKPQRNGGPRTVERRAFHPHVTLARCREPWARAEVERWAGAWTEPPEPVVIDHGSLVASELGKDGPRYRTVATFPLAGAPVSSAPGEPRA